MKKKSYAISILSILIVVISFIIYLAIFQQSKNDVSSDKESDTTMISQDNGNKNEYDNDKDKDNKNDNDNGDDKDLMSVDDMVSEFTKSNQFQQGNTEERVKLMETLMDELVGEGKIKDYKVDLSAGSSNPNILYYYNDGGFGMVMINEFREDQN
ncbi:MAG: hypothetical protein K2M73_00005 [Lachnospiraceae bacterium]|nr:hypothetical protein [Lachnospiraceae bacterium]